MNKELLKNQWILAGLLLAATFILSLIINYIGVLIGFPTNIAALSALIAAMVVGQIYAGTFNEVMPKKLRKNVTIIYTVVQIILTFAYFGIYGMFNSAMVSLGVGLNLVLALVIYVLLGTGGKTYLKAVERQKAKHKK